SCAPLQRGGSKSPSKTGSTSFSQREASARLDSSARYLSSNCGIKPLQDRLSCQPIPDEKLAELCITRTHLVKTHVGYNVLERQWVVSKEGDAPFEIVETNRPGDHLRHKFCMRASKLAMTTHQTTSLVHGQHVPIILAISLLVHGIKANVLLRRHDRTQT